MANVRNGEWFVCMICGERKNEDDADFDAWVEFHGTDNIESAEEEV